jgi:hypothetical protein
MTGAPCKTCLPGVPRHTRQRVVLRGGKRLQLCERCGKIIARLGKLKADEIETSLTPKSSGSAKS